MKKSIIGSLIGLAIVIAADTIIRAIVALITDAPMNLFNYTIYPGFIWGLLISLLTFVTTYAGAAFTITYADIKKQFGLIFFTFLIIVVRYTQIHIVMNVELFFPILSLILSLIGIWLAWKFFLKKKVKGDYPEDRKAEKKHHQPSQNQPDTSPW